jgi:hypothetical protein
MNETTRIKNITTQRNKSKPHQAHNDEAPETKDDTTRTKQMAETVEMNALRNTVGKASLDHFVSKRAQNDHLGEKLDQALLLACRRKVL